MLLSKKFALLLLFHLTAAVPVVQDLGARSDDTTPISVEQANATFLRPGLFERVVYCPLASVANLTCGPPCDALGDGVEVLLAGGNNEKIPDFYIAYDPQTQSIVLARQGTDTDNFSSIVNDIDLPLTDLNSTRFPNQPDDVEVHTGFQDTFERTADQVLATIQSGLSGKRVNKVLITGHSLGAAVSVFDSLYLKMKLSSDVQLNATVFGLPRVGNKEFANYYYDALGTSFAYLTNDRDPVPDLPPKALGYRHSPGEFHIPKDGVYDQVVACEGADNDSCSNGNSIVRSEESEHDGPYVGGVIFGAANCTT